MSVLSFDDEFAKSISGVIHVGANAGQEAKLYESLFIKNEPTRCSRIEAEMNILTRSGLSVKTGGI